jgi:hypothetical protein
VDSGVTDEKNENACEAKLRAHSRGLTKEERTQKFDGGRQELAVQLTLLDTAGHVTTTFLALPARYRRTSSA